MGIRIAEGSIRIVARESLGKSLDRTSCRRLCTFPHETLQNLVDPRGRKSFRSPQGWSYGYKVDQAKAVNYLISNHPEWKEHYHLFGNHWAAMTVVAADLSEHCGLTVCADRIWVGGGCVGLGMVFTGVNMGDDVRTPDDDKRLKKLEKKLAKLKLATPPKLEIICSASFPAHLEEPFKMNLLPPPDDREINRLTKLARDLRSTGGQRQEEQGDM